MTKWLKSSFSILLLSILLLVALVWGLIAPNGIRAAIANNAWSLAFIRQYFNPTSAQTALPAPPQTHPYAALLLARQALHNSDPNLAETYLLPLVQKADPLALNLYAEAQYTRGNYAEAIDLWCQVKNTEKLLITGETLQAQALIPLAEQAYRCLYAINPDRYTQLMFYHFGGQYGYEQSIHYVQTALEQFPDSPDRKTWLTILGNFYLSQSDWQNAAATFQQLLVIDPQSPDALSALGWISYNGYADIDKAVEYYQKLIIVDTQSGQGQYQLAWLYDQAAQPDQAIPMIEQAIRLDPANIYFFLRAGYLYEQVGSKDKALQAYQATLQLDPANSEALKGLDRLSIQP